MLVQPMTGINSLTVLAMVGVGSRFETEKLAGISHFLEHLPFKGTAKYPTPMAVARAIDDVGGQHNAFTSKEYTGYWVKVDSSHRTLALDLVSDLLLTPKLDPQDIERERGVIMEEINMYEDEPRSKAGSVFDELVYAGSPLAMDTIGNKATVGAMTREDFLGHYNAWYDPANVVIGLVGNVTETPALQAEAAELFAKGQPRRGDGVKLTGETEQKKPRVKLVYKKTEQAHFYLGYPAMGWDDGRRYVQLVLATLLGGNSSARLFNEIREKRGLAYYAYASSDQYRGAGSLHALEGVAVNKIEEAIKVTQAEFNKVVSARNLKVREVKAAKEYLIGKLSLDLEDSANLANLLVRRLLLEGKRETVAELIQKIRAVELDQVAALAGEIIRPERVNLAIVGPYKDRGKFEGIVK